ncbi:UNVERIFIED_CONTAM: hypothetical protein K2H54_074952 [Gekko kuhli]
MRGQAIEKSFHFCTDPCRTHIPAVGPFVRSAHFTELLDEFSQDILGQLLNDPFLSEKNELMEVDLSPASPAPLIQAEHSYSLCGDSRPQSPLTHISTDDNFNEGKNWATAALQGTDAVDKRA